MSITQLGDVGVKKVVSVFVFGTQNPNFWYPNLGTFGKSTREHVFENVTLDAKKQKRWNQHLFCAFISFG